MCPSGTAYCSAFLSLITACTAFNYVELLGALVSASETRLRQMQGQCSMHGRKGFALSANSLGPLGQPSRHDDGRIAEEYLLSRPCNGFCGALIAVVDRSRDRRSSYRHHWGTG